MSGGQQVNVYKKLVMKPGAIVEGSWNGSFDRGGTTYYVNNITGSSTADGLSWNSAVAQVSQAVTLSEASRLVHVGTTTNDYVRNTIVVQGTGTAYTKLTALPLYCDIIGLGADPRGNGAGIARIGSDTVAESGVVSTATVRGLNVYNIQFQAGKDMYCFSSTSMFRSRFENCTFMTNGAATGNPTAAFYSTTALGGVVFEDCLVGGSNCSRDTEPDIGFKIAGTHFHTCKVQNCFIAGKDAGIQIASTVVNGWGSIVKDCFIGESSQTCAIGIDDNSTTGDIIFAGNYIFATDAVELTTNGTGRTIGNIAANAFTT